jgi:four helix bundle protein
MAIQKFEDIIGWHKAQDYAEMIYDTTDHIKDYSLKDQIRRAVLSISSNIAEGFDRQSNKEFVRFLYIAIGSCSEVKSLLYFARRRKYCTDESGVLLIERGNEISKIIRGLIQSMEVRKRR